MVAPSAILCSNPKLTIKHSSIKGNIMSVMLLLVVISRIEIVYHTHHLDSLII